MKTCIISVFALICTFSVGAQQDPSPKPNIILFIVDDMGWQDTSVPFHSQRTPFNDRYRTPNMQRLADNGVVFTNAYASAPVCTPTRTSIMTGQLPARTNITYWTFAKDTDTTRDHPTLRAPVWNMNGLQPGDLTLPALLRNAGYHTIHVGKAHFGAHDTAGSDPANLGFDVNIAGHASGAPGSFYGIHHFANEKKSGGPVRPSRWDVPGLEAYHGRDIYLTEALSIEARKAIDAAAESAKPFYMNFAPYAVHTPIMQNDRYAESYADLHPRERAYATMVQSMDAALGDLLEHLEARGMADNTIIIFTSDNGGLSAHARGGEANTHNAPLRSGKGSAYEGGVRVPGIILWPGVIEAGSRSDVPVVSHDLFPTILTMAGADVPDDHPVDGVDLTPLLRGEIDGGDARFDRGILWHQPHTWGARGPGIWPFTSIRRGEWKLIYFHATRRLELYNLKNDIGETINLAEWRPDLVEKLSEELSAQMRDVGGQMSIEKASGQPATLPGGGG